MNVLTTPREAGSDTGSQRIMVIGGLLAYSMMIHWIYATKVSPLYGYKGFTYRSPDLDLYFCSLVIVIVAAAVLPLRIVRASDFVLWALFVIAALPSILIPQYFGGFEAVMGMQVSIGIGTAFMGVAVIVRKADIRVMPRLEVSGASTWMILGALSILVYAYIALTVGLRIRLVGLMGVYELRAEYRRSITAVDGVIGYLIMWQGNVINPIIIARGMFIRRITLVVAGSFGQLLLFSLTGFKTIVMSLPAMLVIAWFFRSRAKPSGVTMLWGVTIMCALCVFVDYMLGSIILTSLFVRRVLLATGVITSIYVAFFTENPRLYLSHSLLKGIIDHPYGISHTRVAAAYSTGSTETSMNANIFADGFANAGWPGVAVAALVLTVVLVLIDDASRGLPLPVCAAILVLPTITLANSAVLTALLTHGVALTVALLAVLPRSGWEPCRRGPGWTSTKRRAKSTRNVVPRS